MDNEPLLILIENINRRRTKRDHKNKCHYCMNKIEWETECNGGNKIRQPTST